MAGSSWINKLNFFARRTPKETVLSPRRSFGFKAGMAITDESSMQVSAFYRGVMYISTQVSKLPWEVKSYDNKLLMEDPVNRLLNLRPNPEMNSMMFRLTMIQRAIIYGNAYAEIERDLLGRPKALWPITTNNIELWRRPDTGELLYRVAQGSFVDPAVDIYIPANDIFHVRNFHTKDGLLGEGVVAYAQNTLGISLGADQMAGNLFGNGGLPSGTLEVQGVLSDEAFKRVKDSWTEAHGGKKSAGIAILEEGMKFNPVSLQPDVMQFLESRAFSVLEIARFLGVPPTKLYDAATSKYSNQEQSNLEVATDTIDTWCKMFEIECDTKLLNNQYGGKKSKFDLYEIFRGDMTTRSNYYSKMMQSASITPNEIRSREGMAPIPDGDRVFLATNNFQPLDRVDELIDSQLKASEPREVNDTPPAPAPAEDIDAQLKTAALELLRKS